MVTNLNDSGDGSLRQAIMDSNDAVGPDEIEFDDTVVGTINLTTGTLLITDELTINGPGADRLTIDANERSRVFSMNDFASRVEIAGLTITGGRPGDDRSGGGILATGHLTVTDSIITGNTAGGDGGGIDLGESSFDRESATLTVINSTISGNTAGLRGGGIYASARYSDVSVTVIDSTISGNIGGGIQAYLYAPSASVNVTNSTISGNTGSGIFAWSYRSGTQVNVTDSTISDNTGNGISATSFRRDLTLRVTNSTISGNTTRFRGGGISASTGDGSASVTVTNSTISGNTADTGGGIYARRRLEEGTLSVTLTGSIVSGNTVGDGQVPGDVGGSSFPVHANHSLLGLAAAALVTTGSDNISDDNPQLAPLADNGGSTQTHALLRGSPAIDAGDPDAVAGENDVPHFDQRGAPFARVVNDRIDIGAYEHSPSTPPADLTGDGFVDFDDLTILLAHWDQRVSAALGNLVDPLTTPVNFQDLTLLLADWTGPGPVGAASPQAVVVEDELSSSDEPQHVDDFVSTSRPPPPAARRSSQRDPSPLRRLQATERAMADYQADRHDTIPTRRTRRRR
ncbi:MAG: right-handed parallel beta-helix repeat-containing protein [Planctomycetes bacterium]|nr:right-handed parallel beta-helix repeat-containing protein [Planctomycetota bacterium]